LGDGLAVRIPQDVIDELGWKAGGDLDVRLLRDRSVRVARHKSCEEAIEDLHCFQG
jgi:antitoxin component of MazEF toxin-antitoxin module